MISLLAMTGALPASGHGECSAGAMAAHAAVTGMQVARYVLGTIDVLARNEQKRSKRFSLFTISARSTSVQPAWPLPLLQVAKYPKGTFDVLYPRDIERDI